MTIEEAAEELLDELLSQRLVVEKFPVTHDGEDSWRRAAICSNARWYQRLCARDERSRKRYPKPRTVIRRKDTIHALRQIAAGRINPDRLYVKRLLPFLRERIADADLSNSEQGGTPC